MKYICKHCNKDMSKYADANNVVGLAMHTSSHTGMLELPSLALTHYKIEELEK